MSIFEGRRDEETRAGKAQSLFREVNERVQEVNATVGRVLLLGDWICECADDGCVQRIQLSTEEYETIRAQGNRFAVAPGDEHVSPKVERVVERHERYWVVEKLGRGRVIAERLDPRAREDSGRKPDGSAAAEPF